MKKLIFILISTIVISCNSNYEIDTIISGNISSLKSDSIYLVPVSEYFPGIDLLNKSHYKTYTDSSGNFLLRIQNFESDYYQIINGKYPQLVYDIFIEKGDSLYIKKPKWNSIEPITITGKGSAKLNYLNTDAKKYNLKKLLYDTIRTNGFATELIFKEYLDSIYKERINTVESDKLTPEKLKQEFKNALIAEKSKFLLNHLDRRNYIMKGVFDYFYPGSSYYEFKTELSKIDSNIHNTQIYELANPLLNHRAKLAFRNKTEEEWWEEKAIWKMSYLKSQPNCIWKDILTISSTYDYSLELSSTAFFDNLNSIHKHANEYYTSKSLNNIFKSKLTSILRLAPGEKAPDFKLPDAKGNYHNLSDYKGNVLYIDFWGTWCYPCIKEIPDALELQKQYKGKPVKFIYVSMESDNEDIDNWRNFINGNDKRFGKLLDFKPFPGIHLVAEKQMRNSEISPYQINFAPTYVLVDQDGNIVSSRAKRSNEISVEIDSLLNRLIE